MAVTWSGWQPLGVNELKDNASTRYSLRSPEPLVRGGEIHCCEKDCALWLARRRRGPHNPQSVCERHGISVSTSPTYVYKDDRRNFIIDVPLLQRVKEMKVESWRLGNERSEDALSWNCFVALARLGGLPSLVHALTGIEPTAEVELLMWGIRVFNPDPRVWDRLVATRKLLEAGAGFPTEPDIILRIPGQAIVLIEAKFGSPNSTLSGQEDRFGGVPEFLDRYPSIEGKPDPFNREWIEEQEPEAILQQLVRNVIFAQHLAEDGEVPIVVNLVRECDEVDIESRLSTHLAANSPVRFKRRTWEDIYRDSSTMGEDAEPLRYYLQNKTNRLTRAFNC